MATTLEFGNDQCLQCLIREHVFIRVSLFQLFDQCFKTEKEEGEEVDFKHNQGRKRKFPYI
jgi:hypothetical protein